MSSRRLSAQKLRMRLFGPAAGLGLGAALLLAGGATAGATLPPWLQHIVGASGAESALYRVMQLPGVQTLFPRPPKEAQGELNSLIQAKPEVSLYALRARADEQALDETAAEADWKLYAEKAGTSKARLELADFYDRRLATQPEAEVLKQVAAEPIAVPEQYLAPDAQLSWKTYIRLLNLLLVQAAPEQQIESVFQAFEAHYPNQPAVYAHELQFLLEAKDYPQAEALITRYHQANPGDSTFPIRAHALIVLRRDGPDQALAVYSSAFQPLWPIDLVQSYFALLAQTHRQGAFVAQARASLAAHPDGPEALNALARIFYYDQQANRTTQAQLTLDQFRVSREARGGQWTPLDLDTLAQLSALTSNIGEVARYDFALASTPGTLPPEIAGGEPAAQVGLAALTHLLLTSAAPDPNTGETPAPLALGAGNLTIYRDIATLDQGPGYWNGILSLWLNGTNPQAEYVSETAKAQTYFHRSKASELLATLDAKYPNAPERASLHAELIAAEAQYGDPAAVIAAGKAFLAAFPASTSGSASGQRLAVAGLMADAYAQQNNTAAEFALYDSLLAELAAATQGQPLTAADPAAADASATGDSVAAAPVAPKPASTSTGGLTSAYSPVRATLPAANQYRQLLDRYIARLVAAHQVPQALALLRRQLDQNPNDPLLYERLATFLDQNNLSSQQDEVYKLAISRFQQPTYYDKLARFYLKQKQRQAFATVTKQVVNIFSGSDLDKYFALVTPADNPTSPGPQLALQLNLYAQHRFPHDLVFTQNLLTAYSTKPTAKPAAYDALIRHQWYASEDLTNQFFEYLSRTGKLDAELSALAPAAQAGTAPASTIAADSNPAALTELAGLSIFTSRYEQSAAPLNTLTSLYPADPTLNDEAISVFRSLAYLDPTSTSRERALRLEQNLLMADPDSPDRLATLGDMTAEATAMGGDDPRSLALAAPYWLKIPGLHPGTPAGFLTSATIFWDYFEYDEALTQIHTARTRFGVPTLYGYEAGAIEENRHDLNAAVAEYIAVATQPTGSDSSYPQVQSALAWAAIDAIFLPPSDAADSNLQSTIQAFFGTREASRRLVQLSIRPATAPLVDKATLAALQAHPASSAALTLRAQVLTAQKRPAEIAPLLLAGLAHAQTQDEAAAIGSLAQSHNLTPTYEAALSRQAELTPDPVEKIQLQYALVSSLEARNQIPQAQAVMASVYAANPRVLGVVRATTDFYARTKQPAKAIGTLLEAAKAATPKLAHDFTLEAANRANEANNPVQARQLALGLLPAAPYDPQVLGVISASYARTNDNAGLKTFYLAQIQSATNAPGLSREQRRDDVALLRRGLIPALTRLNDYKGAEDQYIALISAYPEDSTTSGQAALYAIRYNKQAALETQLVDFLATTVKQSPQDSRFAIDLAQVQTTFGNLPAALAAYDSAIAVRKDRADVYQNRATLELQLAFADPAKPEPAKLDAAADDFAHLYALTYHDPQWQVRIAEIRVRQGRADDAVKALRTAYIEGRPTSGPLAAANAFQVAAQLADWNLLTEARTFAEQGVHLAGAALLQPADGSPSGGAQTYARILTRVGHPETALTTLAAARRSALAQQPAGYKDATDADTRKGLVDQQRQTVNTNLDAAVGAIGTTVQTYDTPEQRQAYGAVLDTLHATDAGLAIKAAAAASLADREAAWRKQQLLTAPVGTEANNSNLAAYTTLQKSRLANLDLARTLEAYGARLNPDERNAVRQNAAKAYGDAGDVTDELRVTRTLAFDADPTLRDHFLDLLLTHSPGALAALAAGKDESLADAAVNYTVAHGSYQQTTSVLSARGKALPAVWTKANLALAGVYLEPESGDERTAIANGFVVSLRATSTIADDLAHPANPKATLTGDLWFSEASRFGLFLNLASTPGATAAGPDAMEAEDYLPAGLEAAATSPSAYLDLARTYAEAGKVAAAQTEYGHVLELAPAGASAVAAHDEQAVLLLKSGNQSGALAEWREGLELLRKQGDQAYPERFYTGLLAIAHHLAVNHVSMQPELEAVLGPYLARNGNYRSNELLRAAYEASANPDAGMAFVISLADSASSPDQVLGDLEVASWLPDAQRETLLRRRLDLAGRTPDPNFTPADAASGEYSAGSVEPGVPAYGKVAIEQKLAQLYLKYGETARLTALLATMSPAQREHPPFREDELLLAARGNRLAAELEASIPTDSPSLALSPYVDAAKFLGATHNHVPPSAADLANALLLDQFVFDRDQAAHALSASDYLTLAQAQLATGALQAAIVTLHGLAAQPAFADASSYAATAPDAYANLDSAAALLESSQHAADALPFLQILAASEPWSATYKLRLAEAQMAAGDGSAAATGLVAVARDPAAAYATRAEAAEHLRGGSGAAAQGQDLGSAELNLLAQPATTAAQAAHPGFTAAQLYVAAQAATPGADRMALLHQAIAASPTGVAADRARLSLFLAESGESVRPADEIALLDLLRQAPPPQQATDDDAVADDSAESSAEDAPDAASEDASAQGSDATPAAVATAATADSPSVSLPSIALTLDLPAQIRLAETLSEISMTADHNAPEALAYLQLARMLQAASPGSDVTIQSRIDAIEAQMELDRVNTLRRPVFHGDLTQKIAVRPRLTLAEAARLEVR